MTFTSWRHGTIIIEDVTLVGRTSGDVVQINDLANVFVGDTRANSTVNNHNKITFKIYCPWEGNDMIARLSLVLEPRNNDIPYTNDNDIAKYFEWAITNRLFPKQTGVGTRNIDYNILALLKRNWLIDLNEENYNSPEKILENKKITVQPLLKIFSNYYSNCKIIKNGLNIEKLGALRLILNKEVIDENTHQNLRQCLEMFNTYEQEKTNPWSTISQD